METKRWVNFKDCSIDVSFMSDRDLLLEDEDGTEYMFHVPEIVFGDVVLEGTTHNDYQFTPVSMKYTPKDHELIWGLHTSNTIDPKLLPLHERHERLMPMLDFMEQELEYLDDQLRVLQTPRKNGRLSEVTLLSIEVYMNRRDHVRKVLDDWLVETTSIEIQLEEKGVDGYV